MSRTLRVISGTLTGWIQFFVVFSLQIILAPLLLKIAGQETLGAYAILIQVLGYIALVDLGLSAGTMRFLSQATGYNDNGERFCNVLSTARTSLMVSNIAFSLLTVLFGLQLKNFVALSGPTFRDAQISIYLVAFWALIRSPWVVYAGGLIAIQEMATANIIYMVGNFGRLLFSITFTLAGMGLKGLMLANILSELTSVILFTHFFKKHHPKIKLNWKFYDKQLFKEIFSFSISVLIINISSLLIFSTDNIVIGFLYGAAAVSIYYSTQVVATAGYNLILTISRNASPAINELFARANIESLQNVFFKLHKYMLLLVIPFSIGILLLNRAFINLWVGPKQYAGDLMNLGLSGLAVIMCMSGINNVFIQAKGNIRFLSILTLIEGIVNLFLSLWLGRKIGISGVLLATFFAHIPTTIYLQWRAQNDLRISLSNFLKKSILPVIGLSIFAVLLLIALTNIISPFNWINFLGIAFSFILIYCILYYRLGLEEIDRAKLLKYFYISHEILTTLIKPRYS